MNRYRLTCIYGTEFEVESPLGFNDVVAAWREGITQRHHLEFAASQVAIDALAVVGIATIPPTDAA